MNPKVVLAFVGGAMLASGLVYVAMRPEAPITAKPVAAIAKPAPAAPADAVPKPEEIKPEKPSPLPGTGEAVEKRPVARAQKPAPVTAKKPEPVRIARNMPVAKPVPSPAPAAPASDPAPVQKPQKAPEPAATSAPQPTPEPESTPAPEPSEPAAERPAAHVATIPAGALISVRLSETVSTNRNQAGDHFSATLDQPLVADGYVLAERGARCEGRVAESERAGRVEGSAHLTLELTAVHTSDGQWVRINTAGFKKEGSRNVGGDVAKVGAAAGIGAAIGGLAGGGKGAGIGAAVGGAAGAGGVMATRGRDAAVAVETRLSFRVQQPVTVAERLR